MKRTPDQNRHEALVAKIPTGAARIYVKTETGKFRYKDIAQLAASDDIQVNQNDEPIVMMGKPGRKRNITLAPANDTVAEILKRKKDALEADPVLKVTRTDPESADVLHQVVLALGGEAASIGFERQEAERKGEETSQFSVRRINALKAMADTWLKRKEQLVSRGVDMDSPAFKTLFNYIVITMREAMDSTGVRPEVREAAFAKFGKVVDSDEWVSEARNRMKSTL